MSKGRQSLEAIIEARDRAMARLAQATDLEALEAWRVSELGKRGAVSALLGQVKELAAEERPQFGATVNAARQVLEAAFAERREALRRARLARELSAETIDVTLPGTAPPAGGLHPVTRARREMCRILADMGFQVYQSRVVETDDFNFGLLNTPEHHPARDMQDTFYIAGEGSGAGSGPGSEALVLRTQTSPGQIRAMRERAPEPLRIILPGVVFRNEKITARSELQFHQIEALAVGRGITMADLKGTIEAFVHRLYGPDRALRFRASYFPFTEPSGEVDVSCMLCEGRGCRVCKQAGWLEIMGCGMVHPVVLANGGYDPERYSGFAFGAGIERVALLRYGIDDIRHFWANDLRFLSQVR